MTRDGFQADWLWPGDGGTIYCNRGLVTANTPLLSAEIMIYLVHRPALLPLKRFEMEERIPFSAQKLDDGSFRWLREFPRPPYPIRPPTQN
jgi:hypothetical protein